MSEEEIKQLVEERESLSRKSAAMFRDLVDIAAALGVDPKFGSMAKRVADLLNMERRIQEMADKSRGIK